MGTTPDRRVPTPQPQRQEQRKSRFLNSEERRLLNPQQDHCPVCFSSRIHVYAERLPSGRPVAGCRACNRLFSLG